MYKEVRKAANGGFTDVDLKKGESVIAFATYNSRDRDKDMANQGMFTKSWNEFKDVRLFKNHDKNTGPGKILKLWDDSNQAYSHTKFGTHTEGQDTLKQIAEGIITDSSYLFVPIKYDPLPGGGYSYKEVFHKEVSVLTHWGAHPESKIKTVQKSFEGVEFAEAVLKELSNDEMQYLRALIGNQSAVLQDMTLFAQMLNENSDLYTWVNYTIAEISRTIADFKYKVKWYGPQQKSENDEILQRIAKMKSFVNNSTASDECIIGVKAQLKELESLMAPVSTQSSESTPEQQKGEKNDPALELALLNLSMLLD